MSRANPTAEEMHFDALMRGNRCNGCGSKRPELRIQVFLALCDMTPELAAATRIEIAQRKIGLVKTSNGDGVRVSVVYACRACTPELEHAAARGPSYAIVTFDRPPSPTVHLGSVPLIGGSFAGG